MKRSPFSNELSREIVSSFLQPGGKPSPYACQLRASPEAETAPDNTLRYTRLRRTMACHPPQKHHKCGGKPYISNRLMQHLPYTLDQLEKLFTKTKDVLRHFMWCARKSVRTCSEGIMSKLQAHTHSSAQLKSNTKKLPATAKQRNTDEARVYRSAT